MNATLILMVDDNFGLSKSGEFPWCMESPLNVIGNITNTDNSVIICEESVYDKYIPKLSVDGNSRDVMVLGACDDLTDDEYGYVLDRTDGKHYKLKCHTLLDDRYSDLFETYPEELSNFIIGTEDLYDLIIASDGKLGDLSVTDVYTINIDGTHDCDKVVNVNDLTNIVRSDKNTTIFGGDVRIWSNH
jgi:hypothetical protein